MTSINVIGEDPVLKSIAQELIISFQGQVKRVPLNYNKSNDKPNEEQSYQRQDLFYPYEFQLFSFLTRPTTCKKLFPPHVQKKRHQSITVQERLILLSIGPKAETKENKGALNHGHQVLDQKRYMEQEKEHEPSTEGIDAPVLVAGLEVLEYLLTPMTTADISSSSAKSHSSNECPLERIIYIAKVDTSGCWPLPKVDTRGLKSPTHALVRGYLNAMRSNTIITTAFTKGSTCISHLHHQSSSAVAAAKLSSMAISSEKKKENGQRSDKEDSCGDATGDSSPLSNDEEQKLQQQQQQQQEEEEEGFELPLLVSTPHKTSLYVFARAQPQYLFAESAQNTGKRVLDDRGLVRWWKNLLTTIYSQQIPVNDSKCKRKQQAWWYIPGMETERQASSIIRFSPLSSISLSTTTTFHWTYGYPDRNSKEMAYSLIPQFPDDPKSRLMQSASCSGGAVDINTFWELVAIGEESGAGKITGFFRIVEEGNIEEDEEEGEKEGETNEQKAKGEEGQKLTGAVEEEPKGSKSTSVSHETTAETTVAAGIETVISPAQGSSESYTKVINYLLSLDFSTLEKSKNSTRQWMNRFNSWTRKLQEKRQQQQEENHSTLLPSWIQTTSLTIFLQHVNEIVVSNQSQSTSSTSSINASSSAPTVNILGAGLIKPKVPEFASVSSSGQAPTVNVLNASFIKRKTPVVNNLSSSLIKRKEPSTASISTSTVTLAPASVVQDSGLTKKQKTDCGKP
ncbi:hypothetical protein BX616_000591 [Lobosporangium transversale]|uniref:histone acetyltransferase n=1 Tax=Lobosporangium transversale TaxID=64571 RepID=A0A1Y2GNG3_9FUNG|nr:histone acetylation protein-domain-containing protein [Lobosporangium transversale]KAF9906880.1 hypothetical protein BX616_000591 [Lobosporangium transversale]ORZ16649.1 histone acetylation protein-domain-containing protein [Lobosporangium transversale]|eukprot:XP_021881584.1 histone acetylation protein-domain-containing protein [Lobosporangium transversale]